MTGNIVSFDIGSAQIKLVWCAGGVCKAAVSAPVPDGLVRGGTIVSMDAMADLLRQLVKENNLPRSAQAAVILPAPLVFTRITELPPMTEGQLTYNLPFEFKDYLTQEKSRYYFDYAVQELVRGEDDSVTRMKLFACATLKTTIEDYRSMMNRAGFKLKLALPEEAISTFRSKGLAMKSSAPMFMAMTMFILSAAEDRKMMGTRLVRRIWRHQW